MNWPSWILSGLALLVAIASFFSNRQKADSEAAVRAVQEVGKLQERCSLLEMKMGMFWRMVEEHLSTMLVKPTHLEMDELLRKNKAHTLTLEEAKRLRWWIQRTYLDDTTTFPGDRLTATLVMAGVNSLIHELERDAST